MENNIYDLKKMVGAYLECAAWTDQDELREADGFSGLAEKEAFADCLNFLTRESVLSWIDDWSPEQVGHGLWLTRNGHGAGFWDCELGTKEQRKALSDAARAMGTCTTCVTDNREIAFF